MWDDALVTSPTRALQEPQWVHPIWWKSGKKPAETRQRTPKFRHQPWSSNLNPRFTCRRTRLYILFVIYFSRKQVFHPPECLQGRSLANSWKKECKKSPRRIWVELFARILAEILSPRWIGSALSFKKIPYFLKIGAARLFFIKPLTAAGATWHDKSVFFYLIK